MPQGTGLNRTYKQPVQKCGQLLNNNHISTLLPQGKLLPLAVRTLAALTRRVYVAPHCLHSGVLAGR